MSASAETADGASHLVVLRRLVKRYGKREALRGLDLCLDGRQIVGVCGPDGAGKTTLIRTLAGLLEIEADEATVLGYDLRRDVTELKARVGYVPQTFSLHRDLSVIENLRFTARLHRLPATEFQERAEALLERTGLAPFTSRFAGALSGGMKQKLAVVNAMLTEPDLLLLDEPTAGVDVIARGEIWDLLVHERERSLTVLSTSYLEEAQACDHLIYLDDGRIVASGSPGDLQGAVPLELYRAWGDHPRVIVEAVHGLSYISDARVGSRFANIEVPVARSPGVAVVLSDLRRLHGAGVRFVETVPLDMESTLLALSRRGEP